MTTTLRKLGFIGLNILVCRRIVVLVATARRLAARLWISIQIFATSACRSGTLTQYYVSGEKPQRNDRTQTNLSILPYKLPKSHKDYFAEKVCLKK